MATVYIELIGAMLFQLALVGAILNRARLFQELAAQNMFSRFALILILGVVVFQFAVCYGRTPVWLPTAVIIVEFALSWIGFLWLGRKREFLRNWQVVQIDLRNSTQIYGLAKIAFGLWSITYLRVLVLYFIRPAKFSEMSLFLWLVPAVVIGLSVLVYNKWLTNSWFASSDEQQ